MKHEIILSPQARTQFHGLPAYDRAKVRDAIDHASPTSPDGEKQEPDQAIAGFTEAAIPAPGREYPRIL